MANNTFQSNIKQYDKSGTITNYALFLGGLNVTHNALEQYDPLRTGYGRIFMIRKPLFVEKMLTDQVKTFKHIIEYANTGVGGNGNISMQFNTLQGGYTNRSMEIPNVATDDSNELTIKTYEFAGSPVREVIQYWITGISDLQSGYSTYHGSTLTKCQANQTAEFVYVVTDQTGTKVEYAALWANCIPKEIKLDHFNYESGTHELVPMDIAFTGTRYMSPQINALATALITKYNVLMDSLNFNGGFTISNDNTDNGVGKMYNGNSGKLENDSSYPDVVVEKDGDGNEHVYTTA